MDSIRSIFSSSFLSSTVASATLYPLDLIKSRYQSQSSITSAFTIVKDVYKSRGIPGFYRGFCSNIVTYPIFWSTYFPIKSLMNTGYDSADAFLAGTVSSLIANPFFVIKTRLQTQAKPARLQPSHLLRGYASTVCGNLKLGVQMPLYEYVNSKYDNVFLAGVVSKVVSSLIFYPFEFVRTIQRYSSVSMSSIGVFREFGGGVYRGIGIYTLLTIPNFTLMMWLKNVIDNSNNNNAD